MSEERWIIVPNWDRFQHYKDRTPPWIKVYLELLSRDSWLDLSLAQRGFLVTVWLLYAATRGQLSTRHVRDRVGTKVYTRYFDSLLRAGYIEVSASKPLAVRYQLASPREEKKEREEVDARAREGHTEGASRAARAEENDYQRAANMVRNGGWQYEPLDFHAELAKFDLTDHQRAELEQLRLTLNGDTDW